MSDYQTFFNNAHDLFCILDKKGNYKSINPAFINLLGYKKSEIMSHSFFYYIHPDDVSLTQKEYNKVIKGKRNCIVENRFRNHHGEYCWISWSSIVADGAGNFYSCGQNITEQKKLEAQLSKEYQESRRKIDRAIIQTQENERMKISQELHDNINQVLTTVKLLIEHSREDEVVSKAVLDRAYKLQQEVIDEIRSLSKSLSSPSLDSIHFYDSVRQLLDTFLEANRLNITLHTTGIKNIEMDQFVHLALYRILQEHFTNIFKHANANNVKMRICFSNSTLTMEVRDDGKGFDTSKKTSGIGLQNMKTRAESIGGTLTINSASESGCTLLVTVPLGEMR
jgi:PAS domain S-box-containing protein